MTSPEMLHVLLCGAAWEESSTLGGPMDNLLIVLQGQHPTIKFARIDVDTDETYGLTEQLNLTVIPTFLFIREKGEVERVEGPQAEAVTKRVEALSRVSGSTIQSKPAVIPPSIVALRQRVSNLAVASPVMIFIKGTPSAPRCKFSRRLLEILGGAGIAYGSFDILSDEAVRQGLKEYSNWPTYPQVFVSGKLVGGIDIVQELKDGGELGTVFPLPASAPNAAAAVAPDTALSGSDQAGGQARTLVHLHSSPLVLFMKGTPDAPACGFSERAVGILHDAGLRGRFKFVDVLEDPGVRECVKQMFDWPTFPMLCSMGRFVGGVNALQEMAEDVKSAGSLAEQLGLAPEEPLDALLSRLTRAAKVVLFMKGSVASPRCGFSAQAKTLLGEAGVDLGSVRPATDAKAEAGDFNLGGFAEFDIFSDDRVREGLKKRENWPTFPMIFVDGK